MSIGSFGLEVLPDVTSSGEREMNHISVCVCTYKRPEPLGRLLSVLRDQITGGLFTYSIVVSDNDYLRSAEAVVSEFAATSDVAIKYCVEPRQNIALARNKAIENATGDFLAFIDDDEFPTKSWLLTLFTACKEYGVDGVLGPVKRHFDKQPPQWIIKGDFYERVTYPTGSVVEWSKARTGNVLVRKQIISATEQVFRPEFRAGEDQDFFRRMIQRGHVFIWCDEALAYEVVPSCRWSRRYMLRKALLRGATAWLQPTCGALSILKSLIAVPVYLTVLPLAFLSGQHRFMELLVRLFDHLGKLLAAVRLNPVAEPYIADQP